MLLLFALVSLLFGLTSSQVQKVSPYWLGEGGGQTLYISGRGFSKDQFSHFDANLGNVVTLVNEADTIPCDVINYLTNTERIVCAVRRRENRKAPKAYEVRVFADGTPVGPNKKVEFESWVAPKIQYIRPISGLVGAQVTIHGYFHTSRYQRMDPDNPLETDNQSGRIITKLYMGGRDCLVYNETSNEPYGSLTGRDVTCIPTSKYAGPMNATVYVTERGSSVNDRSGIRVDSQDRLYQHETFPGIFSVSPSNGGTTGGTLLTVKGVGFDPNPGTTEVKVGGAICKIQEVTDDIISCLTPRADETGPAAGERGLLWEQWNGANIDDMNDVEAWNQLNASSGNYTSMVYDIQAKFQIKITQRTLGRLSGYFHPPHDGDYAIGITLNNAAYRYYVALDGNPENKVARRHWQLFKLIHGSPVYIELDFRGSVDTELKLRLHDYHTKWSYENSRLSYNEKNRLNINPRLKYETQRVTFENTPGQLSFSLHGVVSSPVNGSNPNEIRSAILSLLEQQCEIDASDPKFAKEADFEDSNSDNLAGSGGSMDASIEPFCGRFSKVTHEKHRTTIHTENEERYMIDLNRYPFICFAIKGSVRSTIGITYRWYDKGGRKRTDAINFSHGIPLEGDEWRYHCIDAKAEAEKSSIQKDRKPGTTLKLNALQLPYPKIEHDVFYVDSFKFASEQITVRQTRPSALKSFGILIKDVEVEPVAGKANTFDVKFKTGNCAGDFPLLGVGSTVSDRMVRTLTSAEKYNFTTPSGYAVVERMEAASHPVGGTFDMTTEGVTVRGISPSISQIGLKVLLENAFGSRFVVEKRGDCDSGSYYFEWNNNPGRKEIPTIDESKLVFDGTPGTIIEARRHSDATNYHDPIPGGFFTTWRQEPHVSVTVGGYHSACRADCSFQYTSHGIPSASSMTQSFDGTNYMFTISGSGFTSNAKEDYSIAIGTKQCLVTSVAGTELRCTVDHLPAGNHSLVVRMQPVGAAAQPNPPHSAVVSVSITLINPSTGGAGGGYNLTVNGTGFPETLEGWEGNNITVGDAECHIVAALPYSVTCITPPGSAGSASVVATVNGFSSGPASFTYDNSLSASVSSVTPSSSSVLGGDPLFITGSGFGSVQDTSVVMVGGKPCEPISWSDASIKCTLPALSHGHHPVVVDIKDKGYASGSYKIAYTFKVTGTSTKYGSIYGGTHVVIQGAGFGTNCSLLQVNLSGDMECVIVSCSDSEILCEVRLIPRRHVIRNTGSRSPYGVGYAWEPKFLDVQEGDTVSWVWEKSDPSSQVQYNVFQTSAPGIIEHDKGFTSGDPTPAGSLAMKFPNAQIVYFASAPLLNNLVMTGQVNVLRPGQRTLRVSVNLGGIIAVNEPAGGSVNNNFGTNVDGCGSSLDTALSSCDVNGTSYVPSSPQNDSHLYFITDKCFTPSVTAVSTDRTHSLAQLSGLQVSAGATLKINGTGFGPQSCQNLVKIGDATCTVISATESFIECELRSQDELMSIMPYSLQLKVVNRGLAMIDVNKYESEGRITVVPVVTSFTPVEGSVAGGTKITITGTGLKAFDSKATVSIGSGICEVESVTSTSITCITTPKAAGSYDVEVFISAYSIQAENEMASSTYTYSNSITPTVNTFAVSGEKVTITGALFGSDASKVTVTLKKAPVRHKRSSFDNYIAAVGEPVVIKSKESIKRYDQKLNPIFDKESQPFLYTHIPKGRDDLFEDVRGSTNFWGKFTGTNATTFEETRTLGVWRVVRSRHFDESPTVPKRSKRQAKEEVTTFDCTLTTVTDGVIECNSPGLPAGSYEVFVTIDGKGSADVDGAAAASVAPVILSIAPKEGSIHGGALLTILGTGFIPGEVSVDIGGTSCITESETPTSLTCRTSPHAEGLVNVNVTSGGLHVTASDQYSFTTTKTPVLTSVSPNSGLTAGSPLAITGSSFMLSGVAPEVFVGDSPCALVGSPSSNALSCTSPDLAGGIQKVIVRDSVYGDSNSLIVEYSLSLISITPATGGFGGVEVVLSGTGFDPSGGSSVTVCNNTCLILANFSISSTTLKCLVPSRPQDGSPTLSCDVTVNNPGGGTATLAGGFTYDASLTPAVTAISPVRGGTAGGTTLTISGTGFAASGNEVSIGGSECKIKSESSSQIICVTEAHDGPGKFYVQVTVPNAGIATINENAEFFYIDRWSSIYTWGGEPVPSQGQLVVIEEGQTILLDESTEVLKMLLIKGGHMIVDPEATEEIILRAEYILIVDGGSLNIGSEEEPYMGKAVIELYGNARSIELPSYGAKVLAVRNGSLDLHGAPVPVTWTHLASTAAEGSNTITLKQPVTWKKGDTIIIATTEKRFSKNENEKHIIDTVSADGRTLTLTEPLKYEHISIEQTLGGRVIETRAEVGLLSRNIKIRGNINEAFKEVIEACDEKWNPGQFATQSCFNGRFGEEIGSDQFGATVMIFGKSKDYGLVHGRIEYVEVTEAGQAFQLGRYPLHFHLVGNVNSSYVRGCAIHRTYNRAVTIHAADYLTVERNVAFDNMGHAIFTEDGNEMHNIIQYNLAIYTKTSSSLLNVDVTPSSFWVVNPNNIVRHNAAAGGTHFGYWYRLERHPSGPSSTSSYCQNNEVMGTFYNNTAHSMGRYGLWIFSMDGYFPKTGVCRGNNLVAAWHDFTVWHCDRGAEVVSGGALQFHNFVALDNENAGLEMVQVSGGFGVTKGPGIFNSLLVGHSQLSPKGCSAGTSGIIAPKKYIFSISNTTFVNFDQGTCTALSGCSQCKPFQGGYRVQVKELAFDNSPNKLKFSWEHETIWIDADGSLSGAAENTVLPTMDILPASACQKDVPEFSINSGVKGSVCSHPMKFLRMHLPESSVRPKSLEGRDLIVTTSYGNTSLPYRLKRLGRGPGWMGLLYSGATFKWAFDYSEQITNISYTAYTDFIDPGDYYYVEHTFMQKPDGFGTRGREKNSSLSIPDPVTGVLGDFYWNGTARSMTYLVSRKTSKRKRRTIFENRSVGRQRSIQFRVYRCQYDGCLPPAPTPPPSEIPDVTLKWSDVNTWKEVPVGTGGHPTESVFYLPTEGESITIPKGMHLLVDTVTPPLGRIYVYGTLEFEDSMDHVFECTIIFIKGGRVIAGETEAGAFNHTLHITLRGTTDPSDSDNEELVMPYGTPSVGWKSIGVFGLLSLHGQGSAHSWIKLGSTASIGDSQITLSQAPDSYWLNKEVMITTTGKEAAETEIRTVVAISGNTITLDTSLQYEHLGVTHDVGDGTSYTLSAEVGLLGRNIVISGSATRNSFGGRVIVSKVTSDGQTYKGSAKLSNVEFRQMGQEGFTDSYDPRYSLAFHGLDDNDEGSYVKRCSFNTNYNTALGFFSSDGITAEDNVIYHTVGGSIVDESEGNIFRNNLISLMLFPGRYDGRNEVQNLNFYGGFVLNDATKTILEGNIVAGSEQAGFQTYGEPCEDDSLWSNNEVHSSMFGILLWKKGGTSNHNACRRVKGFLAWRVWDTAFYMQHYASLLVSDVKSIDNHVGVHQLVFGPHALSHVFVEKTAVIENSIFVGASPSHTCGYHESSATIKEHFSNSLWRNGVDGGNAGLLLASFMSGINMAPKHSFHEAASYPAIGGGSYVRNVKFVNFNSRNCGKDVALLTNKESDDAIHPVFVSGLSFVNSSTDNYVYMYKPNLGKVNPSDCVDMSCDGHKKVIIQDMDGSLLGTAKATATAIAEYEWDGDRSHGIGDYRIPVPLRERIDGSKIPAAEKYPNKGIFRDNSCSLISSWRAWKCTGISHRMMIIESMDSDTEIRRLSPIALIGNPGTSGYVDLVNGPMDRGWCFGYTCQERISTFYTVVAPGQVYEMAMTSTPPQVLRFHLLHSDPSEKIILRIFFPKTQRYDIYVDDVYVPPKNIDNSKYPEKYELMSDSNSNSAYIPQLTDPAGSNFLQRNEKFLHVTLHGGHLYEIKTMPTVILNMGLVVDPDNFYEEDIVNNLALMLGVSPGNVRVTNIIREDSGKRRKKRNTVIYQFEFEISSKPTPSANASVTVAVNSSSAEVLSYDDLLNTIVKAVDTFQAGTCDSCNITIAKLEIIEPLPPPKEPPPPATQETGSVVVTNGTLFSDIQQALEAANLDVSLKSVSYEQPSASRLEQNVPPEVIALTVFQTQPVYNVLSGNGSVIHSLGHESNPWMVTATLLGGPADAVLLGTTRVPYLKGAANFTNLSVSKPGMDYRITFNVTHPSTAPSLPIDGNLFNATAKRVRLDLLDTPGAVMANETFNITLQLTDLDTGSYMDPSQLKGQQMSGSVVLMDGGNVQVEGDTSFTFVGGNMASFTLALSFSEYASNYTINITASVQPAGWSLLKYDVILGLLASTTPPSESSTPPKSSTHLPESSTLPSESSTLPPKSSTLSPKSSTLPPKPPTPSKSSTLPPKPPTPSKSPTLPVKSTPAPTVAPYTMQVTLVGDRAADNLAGNEAEFASLLTDVLNREGGTDVHWSVTVSIALGTRPFAEIHVSGEEEAVKAAVKTLCKSVSELEVQLLFKSVLFTMVNMNFYDQGIHRRCPRNLNSHIIIEVVQKVNGRKK